MSEPCQRCGLPLEVGQRGCIYTIRPHQRGTFGVIPDTIDEWNENVSHEGRHFTSRSEKKRFLDATGQREFVRHIGKPGSDKSDHTTRWV